VYVWTVNDPADVDMMIELGVEGIITDRPRYVLRRLDQLGLPRA
jgi:glycerophosphoryl diester phosphodiesterase